MSCGLYLSIACLSADAAAALQAYPPGAEAAGLHSSMPGPAEEGIDVEPHAKRAKLSGEQLSCVRATASVARRLLQTAAVLHRLMFCLPVPLMVTAPLPSCLARSKSCLQLCRVPPLQQAATLLQPAHWH